MSGWKVRLGDGSEIGPMDLAALRTWLAQGLVDGDSPVMRPGSRKWAPLATVPELKDVLGRARRKAAGAATPRAGRRARGTARPTEPRRSTCWRVRVVAGLLLLLAAAARLPGALGLGEASPAFDGAPWLQLALGALALGLALLPGWDLGRRVVRVALLLVAFALFPLAGILIAQGERGAGLLALASVWLFASGLAALLPRTLGWAGLAIALVPVLAAGYGAWRFGRAPETERRRGARVGDRRPPLHGRRARPHPRHPGGLGRRSSPATPSSAPAEARLTLARPRQGGFGYLVTEPAPRGVATAEQYLDRRSRRAARPGLEAGQRSNALLGSLAGRSSSRPGSRACASARSWWRGSTAGWASPSWPGCRRRPPRARRPRRARAGPRRARPPGRPPARRGRGGGGRRAAPVGPGGRAAHVAERGARPRARPGLPPLGRRPRPALSLSKDETRELTGLTTATYAGVPWADRSRLASYVERVRKSAPRPEEDREMAALMKTARSGSLPPAACACRRTTRRRSAPNIDFFVRID